MKKLNYISISLAILCFAGAVGASSMPLQDSMPTVEQFISYFSEAHNQDQAY